MLIGVLIVGIFLTSSFQQNALRSPSVAAVISAILVDLANADRVSNGLGTLTLNPTLVEVAQAKANDMAAKGYFAHTSPEGLDPWHWFQTVGYEYSLAGENLAVDFSDSGDVERAWMNSPTHRDNILNTKFSEIGIATAQGIYQGRSTTFVVQVFGVPKVSQEIDDGGASFIATASADERPDIVPEDPREPAIASAPAVEEIQVLGSESEEEKPAPVPAAAPDLTEPVVAATLVEEASKDIPLWGYIVGFPQETLKYAYYIVAFLILLALAIETGLEMRAHHQKKAMRVGALLVIMVGLFFVADYAFFAEPLIAQTI